MIGHCTINASSYGFSIPAGYVYIVRCLRDLCAWRISFRIVLGCPSLRVGVMARKNKRKQIEQDEALATYLDDYHLEDQPGYILRKVHQRSSEIFNEVMKSFDISPMQFSTMIKLHDFTETSQNRLGRLVAMDPATTLGVVQRLKERGFIEQRNDPNDRRRLLLRLTPDGLAKISAMRKIARQVSNQTVEPLTKAEGATLLRLLKKIS